MLTIQDIMNREVFTISAHASLEEAAWSLAIRGTSAAPVRDGHGMLVGMLSRAELLDPARDRHGRPRQVVGDAMTPTVMVLEQNEPAMAAVRAIVEEGAGQVVVVDKNDDVVGIVTAMDVLKALVHGDRFGRERPDEEDETDVVGASESPPGGAPAY